MALTKFIAPNPLTKSIIRFRPVAAASYRFLNTNDHHPIYNGLHTTRFFLKDCFLPWSPVKIMRFMLNKMESKTRAPGCHRGRWKVTQNTEALLLKYYLPRAGKEKEIRINGMVIENYQLSDGIVRPVSKNVDTEVNQPGVIMIQHKTMQNSEDYYKEDILGRYTMLINSEGDIYNTDAITVENNNTVINISVPKLNPEWIWKTDIKCEWGLGESMPKHFTLTYDLKNKKEDN